MISKPGSAAAANGLRSFLLPPTLLPTPVRSHNLLEFPASRLQTSRYHCLQRARLSSSNSKQISRLSPLKAHGYEQSRLSSSSSKSAKSLQSLQSPPNPKALANKHDRVNASPTTLPAPLDVPEREKGQGKFSYAFKAGKAYLGFYKTGIKNIYSNWKVAREIGGKLERGMTPRLPPGDGMRGGGGKAFVKGGGDNVYTDFLLTRAELQFLRRSRHDMSRVPLFALLFVVFGEWLPLIVVFFTPVVPYTCRIPRQVEKTRRALEEMRRKSFRGEIDGYVPTPTRRGTDGQAIQNLDDCEKGQLMHISRSLGLHFRLWDFTKGIIPGSGILKYRIRKHLEYLAQDDALLLRDGGVAKLNQEEVLLACEQRGIDVLGRREDYLRDTLERWMKGRKDGRVLNMLLSR
ncbi:hypothetical protein E6O75_ATG09398 [Venturia nashicola]|uniref:Letm1 RBD domain-containing protein n=1 Tax=Venturia nashicola TaxID=86259 RepID=A0A4Z1NIF2_9PEZI|nr:hypothetical protein E6O75_ATG09398 [Venturia nashicola]